MPSSPRPVKVVYVTDLGFLKPTLVSVWSLLQHLRGPAEVHIWGVGLTRLDWTDVENVTASNPAVTLIRRDLIAEDLVGAYGPKGHISAATMGRLFIPRLIEGYVLYIDGDTLVTGDVSRLFDVDLGDNYAGVVRDYSVSRWLAERMKGSTDRVDQISEVRDVDEFSANIGILQCGASCS